MKRFLLLPCLLACLSSVCVGLDPNELPIPRNSAGERKLADLKPNEIWQPNDKNEFESSFVHCAFRKMIEEYPGDNTGKFLKFPQEIRWPVSYEFYRLHEIPGARNILNGLSVDGILPGFNTWRLDIQGHTDDYVNIQLQYGIGNGSRGGALASINVRKGVRWHLCHLYYVLATSYLNSPQTFDVDDPIFSEGKESARKRPRYQK